MVDPTDRIKSFIVPYNTSDGNLAVSKMLYTFYIIEKLDMNKGFARNSKKNVHFGFVCLSI